jgi:hypothetical protein
MDGGARVFFDTGHKLSFIVLFYGQGDVVRLGGVWHGSDRECQCVKDKAVPSVLRNQ